MRLRLLICFLCATIPLLNFAQIRSHQVSDSISTPCEVCYDLAWDGKDLWLSHDQGRISRIDPRKKTVVARVNTQIEKLKGLAYDGKMLWGAASKEGKIHRIEPSNGRSREEHPTPAEGRTRPSGLAWDGEMLWNNDTKTVFCGGKEDDATFRFRPEGQVKKEFEGVRDCPFGLAFGGGYLWVGENSTHRIYMIDTANGALIDSLDAPADFINGLAYADQGLWMVSNGDQKADIFRIELQLDKEKGSGEEEQDFVKVEGKGDFFYPNPADRSIWIELPENAPKGKKRLELYGANGKRILIRSVRGRKEKIQLPDLKNGIHHIRILNDGELWRSSSLLIAQ